MPAALPQRLEPVSRGAQEYGVGLYRKHGLEIRQVGASDGSRNEEKEPDALYLWAR